MKKENWESGSCYGDQVSLGKLDWVCRLEAIPDLKTSQSRCCYDDVDMEKETSNIKDNQIC